MIRQTHVRIALALFGLAVAIIACDRGQDAVIVITATFLPPTTDAVPTLPAPPATTLPTSEPTYPAVVAVPTEVLNYVVQPGDTLSGIALAHQTTVETLLGLNDLNNPNVLVEGQFLVLPGRPTTVAPSEMLLADGRLVRGPESRLFDAVSYASDQSGRLGQLRERVDGVEMMGPDIVERVSQEFSVDSRLLLALLEYRGRFLSDSTGSPESELYPVFMPVALNDLGRTGLYRQLAFAADRLNSGYYGRKYRGLDTLELADGTRLRLPDELTPGTSAIYYLFSRFMGETDWRAAVSPDGFMATYKRLFGESMAGSVDTLPGELIQPALLLPFEPGEMWFYTGGPHGGWGSGSAWSAVDFAPPDDPETVDGPCYVSSYFVTAVADGVVARSGEGTVILDLDGDGDESTGWTVLYLHIDSTDRVEVGARLRAGDRIGRPSCEGGVSSGTHVHIARRYNGEWLPASCMECIGTQPPPPAFTLGGWQVVDLPGQEYQGYLVQGDDLRIAEAARGVAPNEVGY